MPAPTRRTARILATLLAAATFGAVTPSASASSGSDFESNAEKIARFDIDFYVERTAP